MMLFKRNRSKINPMRRKSQEGMASIVVVSILVIVLTLISIGFTRLINRSLTNSANRQFSSASTYAAQSAINDVAAYLKQYVATNPPPAPQPKSDTCNGAGSLIGNTASKGPFYNDSNLAGNSTTQYTCLLLNPTPADLVYQRIASNRSQVVKLTTSAFPGSLDKVMVSWQPSCDPNSNGSCPTGFPLSSSSLNNVTNWNDPSSGICKDTTGANASCIPLLKLTLYPIPASASLTNLQANSKTVFLYPQSPSGNVPHKDYKTEIGDGAIMAIPCTKTIGSSSGVIDFAGVPNNKSDFTCNIILQGLATFFSSPETTGYIYLRATPIYSQADVKLMANDQWGQSVNFINDQAVIDATATVGGVAKRLQARVDTSSLATNSNGIDFNISSGGVGMPEQSVRTANALCKRLVQTVSFFSYVSFDTSPSVCHDTGGGGTSNPTPHLDLKITGSTGPVTYLGIPNRGVAKDYTDLTPDSSQKGTSYIDSSGNVVLNWTTTDATTCTATGGSPGWASPPDKNTIMSFTGSPAVNGAGNQTFSGSGITSVTNFTLICGRVGGGNSPFATVNNAEGAETVTAWPPPTASISGPASISADAPYTISWTGGSFSRCTLSGNWNSTATYTNTGGAPVPTQSQTMTIGPQDDTTKTFTVECFDPAGRTSGPKTISYQRGGGGPPVIGPILPPTCVANVSASDNGDAAVNYSWDGACPAVGDPNLGTYSVTSSTDPGFSSISRTGGGTTPGLRTPAEPFCLRLTDSLSPWGVLASNEACATPQPPGPPTPCTANVTPFDNGNGTGGFNWNGACPPANPGRGYYHFYNCVNVNCAAIGSGGWVGTSGPPILVGTGHYCVDLQSGADPWGFLADSGQVCVDIHSPITVTIGSTGIWDNSPRCVSGGNWWDKTWWCHWDGHNTTTWPFGGITCADGAHQWTTCDIYWNASAGADTPSVTCTLTSAVYGTQKTGLANGDTFQRGWGNTGVGGGYGPRPQPFEAFCVDPWTTGSSGWVDLP